MALAKSPLIVIDNVQAFTAGQSQVIGPILADCEVVSVTFHGNTAAVPTLKSGTWDGTTFTAVTTLANGVDGAGGALAATSTALQVGTAVALAANGPITRGQFLQIVSGTNTLARYTIKLVSNVAAASFATETTPA